MRRIYNAIRGIFRGIAVFFHWTDDGLEDDKCLDIEAPLKEASNIADPADSIADPEDDLRIKREKIEADLKKINEIVNNPDWRFRVWAIQNKDIPLCEFLNDPSWYVRREVAKHGYGLSTLINDTSWNVRREVAKHGYGLDKLIDDKCWQVRYVVAEQGYGLEKLINDSSSSVRSKAEKMLNKK